MNLYKPQQAPLIPVKADNSTSGVGGVTEKISHHGAFVLDNPLLEEMSWIPFFRSYDPKERKLVLEWPYIPSETYRFSEYIRIFEIRGVSELLTEDFLKLSHLEGVFFPGALWTEIPTILRHTSASIFGFKSCPNLGVWTPWVFPLHTKWLIFTDCPNLSAVDPSVGDLTGLRKFGLVGTGIEALPDEMSRCRNIELLRISATRFRNTPPEWLFDLPNLAWYSDSGNPFSIRAPKPADTRVFTQDDIELADAIGGSPSSMVYRAILKADCSTVAVKMFKKSHITSDGRPDDDKWAALSAGAHPHLMGAIGEFWWVSWEKGLVLPLVPPESYQKLGFPPSFESCTRDTYPDGAVFFRGQIMNILQSVSSACQHMHRRGMSHGDVYAHNILIDMHGNAVLWDFGAASFYDSRNDLRRHRERIDVRWFGCLVGDLLARCAWWNDSDFMNGIRGLQIACTNEDVASRPTFWDIYGVLSSKR